MTLINAAPTARTLARRAGVPCPDVREEGGWTHCNWQDGPRWGHINVDRMTVTEFNPATGRHERLPLADL